MRQPGSLACAIAIACVLVTGCGSTTSPSRTVNAQQLEASIAGTARSQRHQRAVVICPAGEPVRAGTRFYCAAQTGAAVTPFRVTVGPNGRLTYAGVSASQAPMLAMGSVEFAIMRAERAIHLNPRSVACPAQMPRQRGLEFVCVATLEASRPTSFVVRETNGLGRVSFRPR